MALNISIKEFVNNWIPRQIKWDIMSYALECPISKKELVEMKRRMLMAQYKVYGSLRIDRIQGTQDDWIKRLDKRSMLYPIHFKLDKYFGTQNRFLANTHRDYMKKLIMIITSQPHLLKDEYRQLDIQDIKKWLTENKVKGRSKYKGRKDWKIAVKLIMSV